MKLPGFLKKYFWDTNFKSLDSSKDDFFIVKRLIEAGGLKAVKWLLKIVPQKKIKQVLIESRDFTPKTINSLCTPKICFKVFECRKTSLFSQLLLREHLIKIDLECCFFTTVDKNLPKSCYSL